MPLYDFPAEVKHTPISTILLFLQVGLNSKLTRNCGQKLVIDIFC